MQTTDRQTEPSASPLLVDVRREHIEAIWPHVFPYIERAMRKARRSTAEDVYKALVESHARLWLAWFDDRKTFDAICVTQIIEGAQGRICYGWIVSGKNRDNWLHLITELEDYARHEGCWLFELDPRPGLAREFTKRFGYRETRRTIEKVL